MKNTKIEWCDSTWNPITGCYNNCDYCFARRIAQRFGGYTSAYGSHPNITAVNYGIIADLEKPLYDKNKKVAAYPFNFCPTMHRYRLDQPKKWKEPQTIFVCSMADLFGDWVPDEWINAVFKAAEAAPQHRYLFLTKNPQRYLELEEQKKLPWYDNFYFGTTVTSPESRYTWFMDKEFHWFLSIEPMLERLGEISPNDRLPEWIIVGAETGNRKNKVVPKREWIEDIVKLCNENNIPLFMKDSLIPIVGEENMRREFPWNTENREAHNDN